MERAEKVKRIKECIQKSVEYSDGVDLEDLSEEARLLARPSALKAAENIQMAYDLSKGFDDKDIERDALIEAVGKVHKTVNYVNESRAARHQMSGD